MDEQILKRYEELISLINYYSDEYYNNNKSIISDAEYDSLYAELIAIERNFPLLVSKNSPSARIGAVPSSKLKKIKHITPMLSLENAFSMPDVKKFYERIAKLLKINISDISIYAEPKIDGLSANIRYEGGNLVLASTRGDGLQGEDVTENIRTIKSVPTQIDYKGNIDIRGEVYMTLSSFKLLNEEQIGNGVEIFANPRNAASGSLRLLDRNVVASRNLSFFAYQVIGVQLQTQQEVHEFLKNNGFVVNEEVKLCNSLPEIEEYYFNLMKKRPSLNYEIDGAVYKYNVLNGQKILGTATKYPRHSIAHKFPAEQVITRINNIEMSIGRSGIITPVAILDPVLIGGVVVARATIHNKQEVERKDVRIGDYVVLQRAGDVIPQIVSVVMERRTSDVVKFVFPSKCPFCQSCLIEDTPFLRCSGGKNCSEQFLEMLSHMVSKDAFNITGLGRSNLQFLIQNKFITSEADIFRLEKINNAASKKISQFNGWADLSVRKLFAEINDKKNVSLDRFIYSLGMPQVGKNIAKLLAEKFTSITIFINEVDSPLFRGKLVSIDGVGESIANSILEYMKNEKNILLINDLLDLVTVADFVPVLLDTNHTLFGKRIVFTGTFENMSRERASELAKQVGGAVMNSISSKTDILVAGKNAGSKLANALELKVIVLDEQEFMRMVGV